MELKIIWGNLEEISQIYQTEAGNVFSAIQKAGGIKWQRARGLDNNECG